MRGSKTYLMDNLEEEIRLEIKTDPNAVGLKNSRMS